jgi:hypothetical protein
VGCLAELVGDTWSCTFLVPAYSKTGTWTVKYVFWRDTLNDLRLIPAEELVEMGYAIELEVE